MYDFENRFSILLPWCRSLWVKAGRVRVQAALGPILGDHRTALLLAQAQWLLQAKQKWGFDIAIDAAAADGTMYEVLHIEFDDYDSDQFQEKLCVVEEQLLSIDWSMAAQLINQQRDKWEHLHGFAQNHWKANYLIGWEQAEYTEKAF